MAGLSSGLLVKLKIAPCTVQENGNVKVGSPAFEVMINPAKYKHTHSIKYNTKSIFGKVGTETKYSEFVPEKVSFELVIDGTGVVNLPIPGIGSPDVKTQVQELKDVVYKYDGSNHEPNVVRLLWGSMIFFGRLDTMSVEYTLFKPNGDPLRARVSPSFRDHSRWR